MPIIGPAQKIEINDITFEAGKTLSQSAQLFLKSTGATLSNVEDRITLDTNGPLEMKQNAANGVTVYMNLVHLPGGGTMKSAKGIRAVATDGGKTTTLYSQEFGKFSVWQNADPSNPFLGAVPFKEHGTALVVPFPLKSAPKNDEDRKTNNAPHSAFFPTVPEGASSGITIIGNTDEKSWYSECTIM